jgi:hypothetical protein
MVLNRKSRSQALIIAVTALSSFLMSCDPNKDIQATIYNLSRRNVYIVIADGDGTPMSTYYIGSQGVADLTVDKDSKYLIADVYGNILSTVVGVTVAGSDGELRDGAKAFLVDIDPETDNDPTTVTYYRFLNATEGTITLSFTSGDPVVNPVVLSPNSHKTVFFTSSGSFTYSYAISGTTGTVTVANTNVGYLKAFYIQ